LLRNPIPEHVKVVDFGIRGFDLAYALMDSNFDLTILVDATAQGGSPGTLYTIEPNLAELEVGTESVSALEPHGMDPMRVFRLVKSMGGEFKKVMILGCEPQTFGPENEGYMGLSEPVQAAVDQAVSVLEKFFESNGQM